MTFEIPKETNAGTVGEVTIGATSEQGGTRSHTVTIGGSTASPFHFFEGEHPHRPVVAMEVFDKAQEKYLVSVMDYFGDVIDKPGEMAKKCVEEYGAELISVRLEGTHPEKGNTSVEEAAETVKQVLESVSVPLIITGHSHFEKINEVMKKVCEVAQGENCLINYVETDNYKTIAAACIAYKHTLVAQTPMDVNLAKQLNILLTDMNFPPERIMMDPLTGALGYGLEYTYSIMERIRNDGLAGDKMLAFPMLVNPGHESFHVKETWVDEKDYPEWGSLELRAAYWEIATAMSLLLTGAELLIMYHPKSVEAVKKKIAEMFKSKKAN
ncbi:MAG: acetyl-CoA decarbonylase/synthase complex subunit delta [Candidatus Aminicenantes bacterium]|nr:acetyl-CoA decarbonylase/synthase complex subunit delta [Candidatus Aminicenantes bacterium]